MKRIILSILLFCSLVSNAQVITLLANTRHPVAYQAPPPVVYSPRQVSFTGYSDTMYAFGDSRTDPAFTVSGVSYNYIERVADSLGIKSANHGASGQGVSWMVQKLYDHADSARSNNPFTVWAGYNNVRYIGYSDRLMNKFRNSFKAVLVNQFCDTMVYGGTMTSAGLWNNLSHSIGVHLKSYYASGGAKKGAYTTYTYAANGSQLSWSFTGTAVVVGAVGQDTTNKQSYEAVLGRWQVLIDDVVRDTILPYEQTEGLRPNYEADQIYFTLIKIYPGLSAGAHTIKLRPIDAGKPHFIDWVGTLRAPSLVPPVVFMREMYQSSAGYLADPTFDAGTNAYIDSCSEAMYDAMQEVAAVDTAYWQKMTLINPNSVIDTNGTTHFVSDLIHLNNVGNDSVARYVRRWVSFTATPPPPDTVEVRIDFRLSDTSSGTTGWVTAAGDPDVSVITLTNMNDKNGAATTWDMTTISTSNWAGYSGSSANNAVTGVTGGNYFAGASAGVYQSIWFQYGSSSPATYNSSLPQIRFSGLNPAKTYRIYFAATDGDLNGFDNNPSRFTVIGLTTPASVDLDGNNNNNVTAGGYIQFQPKVDGTADFFMNSVNPGSDLATCPGIIIKEF